MQAILTGKQKNNMFNIQLLTGKFFLKGKLYKCMALFKCAIEFIYKKLTVIAVKIFLEVYSISMTHLDSLNQ